MHLDRTESAREEKREPRILEDALGLPKLQVERYFSSPNRPPHWFWTGGLEDLPVGPSTDWWKEGLIDRSGKLLSLAPKETIEDAEELKRKVE